MKRTNMIRIAAVTITLVICAYSQKPRSGSQATETDSKDQPSKELIAKARGTKLLVKSLPKGIEGLELKDGTLRVKSGYQLVSQPDGTLAVAMINGSLGNTISVNCSCSAGGSCKVARTGDLVYCYQNACTGKCTMTTALSGVTTAIIRY